MEDQLRILTCVLSMAVKKHGAEAPLTLGHLLNICKMAKRYEDEITMRGEKEHEKIMQEINPLGQW
jgi:hypothetical protein